MKDRLPQGKLRVYQLGHIHNPESWLHSHSRYGKDFHMKNLHTLKTLIPGSCYDGKNHRQNILCKVEDDVKILGDLVVSEKQVLSLDNILFDIDEEKIKATVENEEEDMQTFHYSLNDGVWRSRLPKIKSRYDLLHIIEFKTFLKKKNNEGENFKEEKKEEILQEEKPVIVGERLIQNGVKYPKPGGKCEAVWKFLDQHGNMSPKEVKVLAKSFGIDPNNAQVELYQWRKFHGHNKVKSSDKFTSGTRTLVHI